MNNIPLHTPEIKKGLVRMVMFNLYSDARIIFREYVQNALDAIRDAVDSHVLNGMKDGIVKIDINSTDRWIRIRDNGSGIKAVDAARKLLDISASSKNGIDQAGEFGIGRLVGGGFCQQLIFLTSFKGEPIATKITFDVDAIWSMLEDDDHDYLASEVISKCTSIEQEKSEEDEHFFEVSLINIKKSAASALLDKNEVVNYLNVVAPVNYKSQFKNNLIYSSLNLCPEYTELYEGIEYIKITVNETWLEKQYDLEIEGTKDEISNLEFFKIANEEYGLLGWGWFALTRFSVQIPKSDMLAGIRLRKHNIQIGDASLLSGRKYWSEDRGNSYFYGEIFVTHPNISPNAARDGLAPSAETEAFNRLLSQYFANLKNLYTKANEAKKSIEKILDGIARSQSQGINHYNVRDLIDNKGIGKFEKLQRTATFPPVQRMLELYREDYEAQKAISEELKKQQEEKSAESDDQVKTKGPLITDKKNEDDLYTASTAEAKYTIKEEKPTESSDIIHEENEDIVSALDTILDANEVWLVRRIFKVMNKYCPNDMKLISQLQRMIVKELREENQQ